MCSLFWLHVCACTHIHTDIQKTQKLRKLNIYYPLDMKNFWVRFFISTICELWSWDPIWFFEVLIEEKKIFDLIVRLLPITLKLMAEEGESPQPVLLWCWRMQLEKKVSDLNKYVNHWSLYSQEGTGWRCGQRWIASISLLVFLVLGQNHFPPGSHLFFSGILLSELLATWCPSNPIFI